MSNKRGGNIENIKVCAKTKFQLGSQVFDLINNGGWNFYVADRLVHTQLK